MFHPLHFFFRCTMLVSRFKSTLPVFLCACGLCEPSKCVNFSSCILSLCRRFIIVVVCKPSAPAARAAEPRSDGARTEETWCD